MEEELQVLQSIYCGVGEYELMFKGSSTQNTIVKIETCTDLAQELKERISFTFTLKPDYPQTIPDVSISCSSLKNEYAATIKQCMLEKARDSVGDPMILDLITLALETMNDIVTKDITASKSSTDDSSQNKSKNFLGLLQLDHMRSKNNYVKTLVSWTKELGLHGRLLFQGKLILILLLGTKETFKEFIHRLRTVSVDVDSRGRSCKERMMKVLTESQLEEEDDTYERLNCFQVQENQTVEELKDTFLKLGLESVYMEQVKQLYQCR